MKQHERRPRRESVDEISIESSVPLNIPPLYLGSSAHEQLLEARRRRALEHLNRPRRDGRRERRDQGAAVARERARAAQQQQRVARVRRHWHASGVSSRSQMPAPGRLGGRCSAGLTPTSASGSAGGARRPVPPSRPRSLGGGGVFIMGRVGVHVRVEVAEVAEEDVGGVDVVPHRVLRSKDTQEAFQFRTELHSGASSMA